MIDFETLGMPVFTGRGRGEKARKQLKLDDLDRNSAVEKIVVPDEIYAITSSYFLGLFGPSVRHYRSKPEFLEHYQFKAPDRILDRLDEWIDRALREKGAV